MGEEQIMKIVLQRAALMGAFSAILKTEEEKTIDEIKIAICCFIQSLIEQDIVIEDEIEIDLTGRCITFIDQQNALAIVKSIV
jgi:hypothetical protein